MNELEIDIMIHCNHVTTAVTKWGIDRGTKNVYSRFGFGFPLEFLKAETYADIEKRLDEFESDLYDNRLTYLNGIDGFIVIKIVFPKRDDLRTFNVPEARCVVQKLGGKDIAHAFADERFKLRILENLFTAVKDRNVDSINKTLTALRSI